MGFCASGVQNQAKPSQRTGKVREKNQSQETITNKIVCLSLRSRWDPPDQWVAIRVRAFRARPLQNAKEEEERWDENVTRGVDVR